MTLEELNELKRSAEHAENQARSADRRRELIANYRVSDQEPRIQIPRKGWSSELPTIEEEVNKDFTKDVAGDLFRVTEMRLEREARQHRNRARLLRSQLENYLSDEGADA